MIRAVEKIRERLLRAADALESAKVPYAVAGGNAVAAWVSRIDEAAVRNTRDVDILLRRSDFSAARRALEAAGFIYRRVASLGQPGGLDLFLDGPDSSARAICANCLSVSRFSFDTAMRSILRGLTFTRRNPNSGRGEP